MAIKKDAYEAVCGIGVWFGTILLGIVMSFLIRPVFVSRYIMSAAACFWFGSAFAISQINRKIMRNSVLIATIAISVVLAIKSFKNELYQRNQTFAALKCLDSVVTDDSVIISDYCHTQQVISYYYPNNEIITLDELTELTKMVYSDKKLSQLDDVEDIKKMLNKNIIIIDCEGYDDIKGWLNKNNIKYDDYGQYHIDWYDFNIYKISK